MNRAWYGLAAVALVIGAGCDEASAPEGTRGTLTVAAYIDMDGSGTMTPGDTPLAGFDVVVTADGAPVASGQTDASGVATFPDLEPGSYEVEAAGTAPAGTALATSASPTAVINFQGAPARVDFRYVMFPGAISGRIYRDDDESGAFEPENDTPGPGLQVWLTPGGCAVDAEPTDSVRTDATGAFSFSILEPGTYCVTVENPGTIDYGASGEEREVVVVARETAMVEAAFTGSLVIPIDEARSREIGDPVAVIGHVTVPPAVFSSGTTSKIWVQDATGGIAVFTVPTADSATIKLGDRLQVAGTLGEFGDELQIGSPTVEDLGENAVVAPTLITSDEAIALGEHEGLLVTVPELTVAIVPGGTGGSFNVTTTDASGDTLIVRVNNQNTGLTRADFVVGETYTVTGILSQFSGTAQVHPRYPTDVSSATPAVARVIINEFMANPSAVTDASGEWIELHNWGNADADLQGWTIRDNFGVDTIDVSLIIPAGGYLVLSVNANQETNGGVPVDFQYVSSIGLAQGGDRIVLKDASEATIDSVAYLHGIAATAGVSVGVVNPSEDNTVAANADGTLGANWAAQTSTYGSGDAGTPDAENDGYVAPAGRLRIPLTLDERAADSHARAGLSTSRTR